MKKKMKFNYVDEKEYMQRERMLPENLFGISWNMTSEDLWKERIPHTEIGRTERYRVCIFVPKEYMKDRDYDRYSFDEEKGKGVTIISASRRKASDGLYRKKVREYENRFGLSVIDWEVGERSPVESDRLSSGSIWKMKDGMLLLYLRNDQLSVSFSKSAI